MKNEHKLNGKYERDIAKLKSSNDYSFDVLDPVRTEKILLYLRECKAGDFSFTATTSARSSKTKIFDKEDIIEMDIILFPPLRQHIYNAFALIELFLREYANMVQHQLNLLQFTESDSNDNAQMVEHMEIIYNQL
ncbi:hypothetical protein RFI_31334 [Reticulomyxa filosa]|uniref:Uncharacterized protein n=1 Tax=Reticulomyxa filosa TaxID=46433 RepID=X6LZ96_RETFI|nr:hypothetical protein RFI_31334 [Reticulomyxa filosa]|eukprot:ETO06060.1 hypothetical protein RFI_31334 [Reticulomyxa filosa]